MGDQVGLVVLVVVAAIILIGSAAMTMHRRRNGDEETLNHHQAETLKAREDHPEGAERSHLVGNPPIDTVTKQGWGVATPGEGALDELPMDVHPELHDSDVRHRRQY